jgi:hypothetical protein
MGDPEDADETCQHSEDEQQQSTDNAATGHGDTSPAEPATDSLKRTRLFVTNYVKGHYLNRCASIVKPDDEMTLPIKLNFELSRGRTLSELSRILD